MKTKIKIQFLACLLLILASSLVSCSSPSSNNSNTSQAIAPTPETSIIVNNSEEESATTDAYTVLQAGMRQLNELDSYKAKQDYYLLMPESLTGISILTDCVVNNSDTSSYCKTQVSFTENGEPVEINSELVTTSGKYWFRRQGEAWQEISAMDASIPGLINGKIAPFPYLELVTNPQYDDEFVSSDGNFDQILFETDIEAFLGLVYGEAGGQRFYQNGKEFDFSGHILIKPDDEFIYEHSALLDFLYDNKPIQIQLKQSLDNFNGAVDIPDISE